MVALAASARAGRLFSRRSGGGRAGPSNRAGGRLQLLGPGNWFFENLRGVTEAMPGYSGGSAATAHYEMSSTGMTGHAESVRVTYDPSKISLDEILNVFFTVSHDPTELNYQGPDEGTQYRSAIFVANAEQRRVAQDEIAKLTAEHRFKAPIVTKLETFHAFYPAEAYHRHYATLHPDDPYIVQNDAPKLVALKKVYPQLVAQK